MSWYRRLLWKLLFWRELGRLHKTEHSLWLNVDAYRRRLLDVDEPANPRVSLDCQRRKRAWAAAQAIYDAIQIADNVELVSALLHEALPDGTDPEWFWPIDHDVLREIASHLHTLHDEDVK